uniref:Uncharacterized protein n=1 Tax=Helianthus annuus TaxID=4232 RepID=A0A251VG78_HELAN
MLDAGSGCCRVGLTDPLYFFFFLIHLSHHSSTNPKKDICCSLSLLSPPPRSLISFTKSHLPTIIFYHFNLMVFLIL